jgi:hypothetical protein
MASNLLAPWVDAGGTAVWAIAGSAIVAPTANAKNAAKTLAPRENAASCQKPDSGTECDMKGTFDG